LSTEDFAAAAERLVSLIPNGTPPPAASPAEPAADAPSAVGPPDDGADGDGEAEAPDPEDDLGRAPQDGPPQDGPADDRLSGDMLPDDMLPDDALPDDSGPPLRTALESIMMVADEPIPEVLLAQVLERPRGEVSAVLRELSAEYTAQGRGFDLREIAGGWRFYTRPECAPVVERFVRDGQEVRLTQAALESLAVVAYRQPVSRARVSAVRGVNCDGVMRTLVLRGLVEESGSDSDTGAILYRTTGYFLERMGLTSLEDLPALAPFLPDDYADIED
jgi:segregation and condensation protein B